jgi:hypothetical protein
MLTVTRPWLRSGTATARLAAPVYGCRPRRILLERAGLRFGIAGLSEVVRTFGRRCEGKYFGDGVVDGVDGRSGRLAKNFSIGLRSGEYLGRKKSLAPAARMARRTALPL